MTYRYSDGYEEVYEPLGTLAPLGTAYRTGFAVPSDSCF